MAMSYSYELQTKVCDRTTALESGRYFCDGVAFGDHMTLPPNHQSAGVTPKSALVGRLNQARRRAEGLSHDVTGVGRLDGPASAPDTIASRMMLPATHLA